jgi:thymidylate kinase
LFQEVQERDGTDQTIFFADRSPYSAVFYARGPEGKLLEPLIQAQLKQLKELAGITIITIYVKVDQEVLWSRIQQRLLLEPFREKFNESSREWMEKTGFLQLWFFFLVLIAEMIMSNFS